MKNLALAFMKPSKFHSYRAIMVNPQGTSKVGGVTKNTTSLMRMRVLYMAISIDQALKLKRSKYY